MPFFPSLEDFGGNSFVPGHPEGLMKYGRFHDVPVIIGVTSADGKLAMQPVFHSGSIKEVNENFERAMNWNWKYYLKENKFKEFTKIIKNKYLRNKCISEDNITKYIDLQTDLNFRYPLYKMVHYMLKHKKSPIYIYQFCRREPLDYALPGWNPEISHLPGAAHEADMMYLFHSELTPPDFTSDPTVHRSIKTMVKLWTDFAKHANPCEELNIEWPSVKNSSTLPYLNISEELTVQQNFIDENILFLDSLIEGMNFYTLYSKI